MKRTRCVTPAGVPRSRSRYTRGQRRIIRACQVAARGRIANAMWDRVRFYAESPGRVVRPSLILTAADVDAMWDASADL